MAACRGRIFRHGRRMDRAHRIMLLAEPTPSAPRPARTPLRRITAWKPQAMFLIMAHTRSAPRPDRTPPSLHPLRWMPTIRTIRIMAAHGQAAFRTRPISPGRLPIPAAWSRCAVVRRDADRSTYGRPQGGAPAGDSYYFLDQWRRRRARRRGVPSLRALSGETAPRATSRRRRSRAAAPSSLKCSGAIFPFSIRRSMAGR